MWQASKTPCIPSQNGHLLTIPGHSGRPLLATRPNLRAGSLVILGAVFGKGGRHPPFVPLGTQLGFFLGVVRSLLVASTRRRPPKRKSGGNSDVFLFFLWLRPSVYQLYHMMS